MKQLVCEMCNSNELVKDGDYFVCQHCGCKYTVETVKKMMVEGTVDVSGSSVRIDTSDREEKILAAARKAMKAEDYEAADRYYNELLLSMPDNWEVMFYSKYSKIRGGSFANASKEINALTNKLKAIALSIGSLTDNEQVEAIERITREIYSLLVMIKPYGQGDLDLVGMLSKLEKPCDLLVVSWFEAMSEVQEIREPFIKYFDAFYSMACDNCRGQESFMGRITDSDYEFSGNALEVPRRVSFIFSMPYAEKDFNDTIKIDRYSVMRRTVDNCNYHRIDEWKEFEAKYRVYYKQQREQIAITKREIEALKKLNENGGGGCYVATAVYGSYDCPEVWTLRRYRDYELAETWYGRAFIRTYYAISPTLVKWFGDTKWFKKMWRGKLDHMVNGLRKKGYEDTPYEDREW